MSAEQTSRRASTPRIGVIGAGVMGTSLAAIIGRTAPTVMVCRNPKRAATLFEHGARTVGEVEASSRPLLVHSIAELASAGGVSVLFVATKTTAIPQVARELKPVLTDVSEDPAGLFLISYQNGIEPGRQLMSLLGYDRVLRMVLNYGARFAEGGNAVEVTLNNPPHHIGSDTPEHTVAAERIGGLLTSAGLETRATDQIEMHVWSKAILNAAMNPVAALVNASVADVMASPSRTITMRLLEEGLAVARAEGLPMADDFMESAVRTLDLFGPHTPSMVEDIRSGRESEVGQLNRQVIDHGRALGVATPTHEVVDALIETFDWKVYRSAHANG